MSDDSDRPQRIWVTSLSSVYTLTSPSGSLRTISDKVRAPSTTRPSCSTAASMVVQIPDSRSYPVTDTAPFSAATRMPSSASMVDFRLTARMALITASLSALFSQVNFIALPPFKKERLFCEI